MLGVAVIPITEDVTGEGGLRILMCYTAQREDVR